MVIDSHAHLWKNPEGLDSVAESGLYEQIWLMEVTYYVGSVYKDLAPRADILEAARRYPGFFVPFGCIDFTLGPEQVDRMKELGFHGLKAIRPHLPYDDPSFLPIYERAAALKMPILFHVGIIAKNKPDEMVPFRSLGPTNMRPSMLDGIAAAFPELPLIAGHMGFPWENELFECLYYYPNTYCAVCGYIDYSWLMNYMDRRCPTINNPHETVSDRMLFATDTCYGRPESHNSAARFADFMGMFFRYVGRSYQWGLKGEAFLRGNARRIIPGPK